MKKAKEETQDLAARAAAQSKLLDALLGKAELKNDAALSRALEVAPPVISKLRKGVLPLGAVMILKIHELLGVPVAEVRQLLAA